MVSPMNTVQFEALADQLNNVHPEQRRINQCYQVQFISSQTETGDYKQTILSHPNTCRLLASALTTFNGGRK
ncbi:MAG: hypothetical protein ACI88G_001919 [Woeseiaceae bacterium]|jgi:hypothetical protein